MAPDIKSGPELLVNEIRCLASELLISFLFLRSAVTFAPIGYPPVIPKKTAMEDMPGSLKRRFIIGDRKRANKLVMAVC